MNTELIEQIKDNMIKFPTSVRMGRWFSACESSSCGTAGCIAGWACALSKRLTRVDTSLGSVYQTDLVAHSIFDIARSLLDISIVNARQLFYPEHWPEEFIRSIVKGKDYRAVFVGFNDLEDKMTEDKRKFFADYFYHRKLNYHQESDIVVRRLEYLQETGE